MGERAIGSIALSRLKVEESLLWEGKPLFLPFLLGSPRATGLGAGAMLFFLTGAALTLLDRRLHITAPLFLAAVVGAFAAGYLLGVYLDWRALVLALTDKRFLAFGAAFPLSGWELSFPLGDILGVEVWRRWADVGRNSGTLVIHGSIGGSIHTGIWAGVPDAFMLEEMLKRHILMHAKRASVKTRGRVDGAAATELALHHLLAPEERLLWAATSDISKFPIGWIGLHFIMKHLMKHLISSLIGILLGLLIIRFLPGRPVPWKEIVEIVAVSLGMLLFILLLSVALAQAVLSSLPAVYALTERRLLALGRDKSYVSWLRLDGLRPPSINRTGKREMLKAHPVHGVTTCSGPHFLKPGAGVLILLLSDRGMAGDFLALLSEAISSTKPTSSDSLPPSGKPQHPATRREGCVHQDLTRV